MKKKIFNTKGKTSISKLEQKNLSFSPASSNSRNKSPKFSDFWHPSKNKFCCEWWYFSFFLKGGGVISICYSINGGNPNGKIWASIHLPEKKHIFISEKYDDAEASKEEVYVNLGGNTIREEKGNYSLYFSNNKISLNIGGKNKIKLKNNIFIKKSEFGTISWIIPVLKGSFQGELKIGKENYEIEGIMFHDHVLRDIKPKKSLFSFKKWIWGVQYSKNQTILFVNVDFEKSFNYLLIEKNGKVKKTDNFQINLKDNYSLNLKCDYGEFCMEVPYKNFVKIYHKNKLLNKLSNKYHCYGFENGKINYVEALIRK